MCAISTNLPFPEAMNDSVCLTLNVAQVVLSPAITFPSFFLTTPNPATLKS